MYATQGRCYFRAKQRFHMPSAETYGNAGLKVGLKVSFKTEVVYTLHRVGRLSKNRPRVFVQRLSYGNFKSETPQLYHCSSYNNVFSDPKSLYSPIQTPCHFSVIFFHILFPRLFPVIFYDKQGLLTKCQKQSHSDFQNFPKFIKLTKIRKKN